MSINLGRLAFTLPSKNNALNDRAATTEGSISKQVAMSFVGNLLTILLCKYAFDILVYLLL